MHTISTKDISVLLFDWDGTLVDSAHLGLAAYQKAFADLGVAFGLEAYEAAYSPNWYRTYEALGLPRDMWDKADELWTRHYRGQTAEMIPGAVETLRALQHDGYRLGVVTSGQEERVCREIAASAVTDIFEVVICHEHISNRKPHPEGLQIALARLGVSPEQAGYVGDTPEDVEMGQQADVLTVGIRSNYPSSARLLVAEPDIYIESISRLTDHFPGVSRSE